jgi:signal transduction histidine kinase
MGIEDLLIEENYEVITAENGKQGIKYAKEQLPDLIISDILMPDIDGYAVFSELQKEVVTCRIPFIFLTARADVDDIRYGMNLGADDYLTKPYKADDLITSVNSRLSKRKYIDKKFESFRSNIAKSVPHEFRTPLVTILGLSQLILDNEDQLGRKELLEMVAKINKAGSNLNKMIGKFLLFSELDIIRNDKDTLSDFSFSKTNLTKGEVHFFVKPIIIENGREDDININIEEANVVISQDHLKLIIEELVNNACKFSGIGSRITIESYLQNENYIIEVKDQGVGMTVEQIKQVGAMQQFDRNKYFQGGLGMGLVLIKKILSLYNGEMTLTSEKDHFTTVRISLKIFKPQLLDE